MHLSDEDKRSILEESRDIAFQKDLKSISGNAKKMSLLEYLDFLTTVSKIGQPVRHPDPTRYHTVIF